jgi:mannose-6-phosphate isomerase-like protein (cupin superfamily)
MKLNIITEKKSRQQKSKGFIGNIEDIAKENTNFRQVLYTAKNCQLVVMSLAPGEEIGEEIHDVDQFFRVEAGTGQVVINGTTTELNHGSGVIVPSGSRHNVINSSDEDLKIYTIYSPPHHKDGTVHKIAEDAKRDTEHFDGETTE